MYKFTVYSREMQWGWDSVSGFRAGRSAGERERCTGVLVDFDGLARIGVPVLCLASPAQGGIFAGKIQLRLA